MMTQKNLNQRGFMLLSAIFLALIVSMGATILLHANAKVQQRNSTLYLTAINLANEQFAELENLAAGGILNSGSYDFLGDNDDLKSLNGVKADSPPVEFEVETTVAESGNLREVKITVKWTVGGEEKSVTSKKILRVQ